jgi:thymidylate kinase
MIILKKKIRFYNYQRTRWNGIGKKLREILLNYDGKVATFCELFLYLSDRISTLRRQ